MSEFFSCRPMADFNLTLEGRVDADRCISVCCEKHIPMLPAIGLADTAEETLERFLGMRVLTEAEFRDHPEQLSHGCGQCVYFRRAAWNQKAKISYVNLSMYPAPCQSKCVYCSEAEHLNRRLTPEVKAAYEKLFDFLEYAKKRGIIDPKAVWQVSSGEITLHPYKDRILELVRDCHAVFYTNAFLYDEAIAQRLHDDPATELNLSIDAGTAPTWQKIKGFDNFETVLSNLRRYRENSARPGQIVLKYIVLPGVNDGLEDINAVIEIAKQLEVRYFAISRDTKIRFDIDREYRVKLFAAAARLLAFCKQNAIAHDMFTYSFEEQAEVERLAEKLLAEAKGETSASSPGKTVQPAAEPKVSVIIPVYNDEAYLREALDSVVSQTLHDIEIVCVSDGSTDGSDAILREYAARDGRFRVIRHEENKGTLMARKTGVNAARGDYLLFLDADDEMEPECCETALNLIWRKKVDILCFSTEVQERTEGGSLLRAVWHPDASVLDTLVTNPKSLPVEDDATLTPAWGKIIRARLVRRAFDAMDDFYAVYGEDVYTAFFLFHFAESVTGCVTPPLLTHYSGRGICGHMLKNLEHYRLICRMSDLSRRIRAYLEREGSLEENQASWQTYRLMMARDCCLELNYVRPEDIPAAKEILMNAWGDELPWKEIAWRTAAYKAKQLRWSSELNHAKQWLESQVQYKDARIAELEGWTKEQDKAKAWFLGQIGQKDRRIEELEKENAALRQKSGKPWHERLFGSGK